MSGFGRGAAVFGTLSALTAVAAAVFLNANLNAWTMLNFDPQGFDQEFESWLIAAAFGYTSGALTAADAGYASAARRSSGGAAAEGGYGGAGQHQ